VVGGVGVRDGRTVGVGRGRDEVAGAADAVGAVLVACTARVAGRLVTARGVGAAAEGFDAAQPAVAHNALSATAMTREECFGGRRMRPR
jgi:hypothetical protein